MRAEEYIEKYPDINSTDLKIVAKAMSDIVCGLLGEVQALAKTRHANSNEACISILNEINKKWHAILKRVKNSAYDLEKTQLDVFKVNAKKVFNIPDKMWN